MEHHNRVLQVEAVSFFLLHAWGAFCVQLPCWVAIIPTLIGFYICMFKTCIGIILFKTCIGTAFIILLAILGSMKWY